MKKSRLSLMFFLVLVTFMVSSCSAITGIFKAGMGFGIFFVLAIFVIIAFIIMQFRKKMK